MMECPLGSFYLNITGIAANFPTGYVPYGNPNLRGEGVFTFHDDSMDWSMRLSDNKYDVTQAHIYSLDRVKEGDSWACWGGRWTPHDFLEDTGFEDLYGITADDIASAEEWVIMLHTEGGHFAVDEDTGDLVVYNADIHETSVTGTREKGSRFNNRVPRKLTNRLLREFNTNSGTPGDKEFDTIYPDPDHFRRTQDEPFPDMNGNVWIEWDDTTSRYVPSSYGRSRDLTLDDIDSVEYLFYLYDDHGPVWDWGGPEGAGGGILIPCSELPTAVPTTSPLPTAAPTASPVTTAPAPAPTTFSPVTSSPAAAPTTASPVTSAPAKPTTASPVVTMAPAAPTASPVTITPASISMSPVVTNSSDEVSDPAANTTRSFATEETSSASWSHFRTCWMPCLFLAVAAIMHC